MIRELFAVQSPDAGRHEGVPSFGLSSFASHAQRIRIGGYCQKN